MPTVTVSPEHQIVIPKEICERLNVEPGQQFQVIALDGQIILVPIMSLEEAYGFVQGIDTDIQREREDRV